MEADRSNKTQVIHSVRFAELSGDRQVSGAKEQHAAVTPVIQAPLLGLTDPDQCTGVHTFLSDRFAVRAPCAPIPPLSPLPCSVSPWDPLLLTPKAPLPDPAVGSSVDPKGGL